MFTNIMIVLPSIPFTICSLFVFYFFLALKFDYIRHQYCYSILRYRRSF